MQNTTHNIHKSLQNKQKKWAPLTMKMFTSSLIFSLSSCACFSCSINRASASSFWTISWAFLKSWEKKKKLNKQIFSPCAVKSMCTIPLEQWPLHNEQVVSNWILVFAKGQTLQLARKKCMARGCFNIQRNNFGERFSPFHCCFIRNGFELCWYKGSTSFCLNNLKICSKIYLI